MAVKINEGTNVSMELRTIIGLGFGLVSLAGIYFTLTGELQQLKIEKSQIENKIVQLNAGAIEVEEELEAAQLLFSDVNAKINQLVIDNGQMRAEMALNSEFRIMWPRGEMGSLPDDAEQNLRLDFVEAKIEKLENIIE